MRLFDCCGDCRIGRNYPAFELVRRQTASPAIKQLHCFSACIDLTTQIADGDIYYRINDRLETGRIRVSQLARRVLIAAAFAIHHVSRDRPRTSREAQHGHIITDHRATLAYRLVNCLETLGLRRETRKLCIKQARRKFGSFANQKLQPLAHRMWHNQDIGEQDCTIKPKPAQWLDRDFRSRIAVIHQIEKTALLRSQFAILRKVASSLAHQPHRWSGSLMTA